MKKGQNSPTVYCIVTLVKIPFLLFLATLSSASLMGNVAT